MKRKNTESRVEVTSLLVERDGVRLDSWLAAALGVTRSEAARMAEQDRVLVDGHRAAKSMKLKAGQSVVIEEAPRLEPKHKTAVFDIRYEDEHLAVISKPAGLVVHPAPGTTSETLVEALQRQMPLAQGPGPQRPGVVHRLDKDTSGLLVVAKTDLSYTGLIAAIKQRKVERTYTALVQGRPDVSTGRIEAPVGRLSRDRTRMGVGGGKAAVTEFRVVRSFGSARTDREEASLLEVKILTGRTHQIRVHMSHIGHPIVGDASYGRKAAALARKIDLRRPFLHASRLSFLHPVTGERVEVEEPLPEDLSSALKHAEERLASGGFGGQRTPNVK